MEGNQPKCIFLGCSKVEPFLRPQPCYRLLPCWPPLWIWLCGFQSLNWSEVCRHISLQWSRNMRKFVGKTNQTSLPHPLVGQTHKSNSHFQGRFTWPNQPQSTHIGHSSACYCLCFTDSTAFPHQNFMAWLVIQFLRGKAFAQIYVFASRDINHPLIACISYVALNLPPAK